MNKEVIRIPNVPLFEDEERDREEVVDNQSDADRIVKFLDANPQKGFNVVEICAALHLDFDHEALYSLLCAMNHLKMILGAFFPNAEKLEQNSETQVYFTSVKVPGSEELRKKIQERGA